MIKKVYGILLLLVCAAFAAAQAIPAAQTPTTVEGAAPVTQAAPAVYDPAVYAPAAAEQRAVREQTQTLHVPVRRYGVTIDTAAGVILRTELGSAGFSQQMLYAQLPFRYGCAAASGGTAALLSGISGATANMQVRYGSIAIEAGAQNSLCTVGLRAGLTEWDLRSLCIKLPSTELKEQHLVHRWYHAGVSGALPAYQIRYDGDWYWGTAGIGLHDLGYLIATPSGEATASIHRLRLTQWYEGSISVFKLDGTLSNKTGESVASGVARAFVFQNTANIPIAAHSTLSVSASYSYFSGRFSIRLTAENQGYFLFPYRFYNREFSLNGSVLGFGGAYRYTTERIRFYGAAHLYSVVHSSGRDTLHSKEKKSLLFKGREEQRAAPLPSIAGTSLLLLRFSIGFAITPNAELSAGKTIPIPILSPQLAPLLDDLLRKQTQSQAALSIDPLLTGFSVRLTVRL